MLNRNNRKKSPVIFLRYLDILVHLLEGEKTTKYSKPYRSLGFVESCVSEANPEDAV